jgi:hypothetical protein
VRGASAPASAEGMGGNGASSRATDGLGPGQPKGGKSKAAAKVARTAFKLTYPDPSEDQFGKAVADFLGYAFNGQDVVWSHFPAGGYYLSRAAAARLYRLGLQRGMPDLMICWIKGTIWIETKTPTGVVPKHQREMHTRLRTIGQPVGVCRSLGEVIAFLKQFGVPMNRISLMGEPDGHEGAEGRSAAQLAEGARGAA